MRHSNTLWVLATVMAILVLIFLNLVLGSVSIPFQSAWHIIWNLGNELITWQDIIWKSWLSQALTVLVAGVGLSISGLQMQTVFRNPSAGPSVLGISLGANMGVAFMALLSGSLGGVTLSELGFMGETASSIAAVIGFLSVMALIVYVSQKVKGNVTSLIIGVIVGYAANAVIDVLKFSSVKEDIRACVIWGLGSFARISGNQITLSVIPMTILIPLSFLLIKTMNLMLFGDSYVRNLGFNIKRVRLLAITSAGVLTATATAHREPIIFLGLAVPYLCRAIFQTSDHRILMPVVLFAGVALASVRNSIARMPGFEGALPVNSVTVLVDAPVVASILFKKHKNELNE